MSPEEKASVAALQRLRRELDIDRESLSARYREISTVQQSWEETSETRSELIYAAALLHAYYTGIEAFLERVARQLDGEVPTSERWHRQLLSQAVVEVPGVRPEIFPGELESDLIELLRFRHFFRHAYGLELDPERVKPEVDRVIRIHPPVVAHLDAFDGYLAATIRELSEE